MHTVVETPSFLNGAKDVGLTEDERFDIKIYLSENPEAGELMSGTGGARKVRFPFGGKGRSGGVRVVTFYCEDDVPVFLLDVFKKSDKINLSKAERNELKGILSNMADEYRQSVKRKVAKIKKAAS